MDDQASDYIAGETEKDISANDVAPKNGFRERLGDETSDFADDDFTRSLDPAENPHLDDQLNDENLQREAEADY